MKWIKEYSGLLNESMDQESLDLTLLDAAWGNKLDTSAHLLQSGANPNKRDHLKQTPLHKAAYHGHVEMAKLLLEKGAQIDAIDWSGRTPLHAAVSNDRVIIIRLLIDRGADVDAEDSNGWTPLWRAARWTMASIGTVKLLILLGANPSKAFGTFADCKSFFDSDLSWAPGGEAGVERQFRASETRRKLF